MSDGVGGTYWAAVSSAGTYPSFQQIIAGKNTYTANPSSQTFTIVSGNGIGFLDSGGPGSNTTYIYAKAFQTIGVNGLSSIQAFTNGVPTPTLNLSSVGGLQISTDTTTQTVFFNAGLKTIQVIENTPTFTSNLDPIFRIPLPITPLYSTLTFYGQGDVNIYADQPTNALYFGLNGFTLDNYNTLSTNVAGLSNTILGAANSLYVNKANFSTGLTTLSTNIGQQLSTYQISSTYLALSTYTSSNVSTIASLYSTLSTSTSYNISSLSTYFYGVNQSTLSTFIYGQLASTSAGYSAFFSTLTYGQVTSTLSSFNSFGVSSLSLVSTTSNLLTQISCIAASSLTITQNSLSTMSTTMTSSLISYFSPKISIVSSLGYSGIRGDGVNFTYDGTGKLVISTATLNFAGFTSSIRSAKADISLEYNPVILFPMATATTVLPQNISTYVQYADGTLMSNATFSDYVSWNQYSPGADASISNVYSKYIRIRLDAGFVASNGVSNYTIYHLLPTASLYINSLNTTINSTCHIRTPAQNSLFLNLFNKD
jgi:hypothetical protein